MQDMLNEGRRRHCDSTTQGTGTSPFWTCVDAWAGLGGRNQGFEECDLPTDSWILTIFQNDANVEPTENVNINVQIINMFGC